MHSRPTPSSRPAPSSHPTPRQSPSASFPVRTVLAVAIALLVLAPAALARQGSAPTEPGTYRDWNDDLDEVEIVETFSRADYTRLVVAPFATENVPLPDEDDNSREPAEQVLADVESPLVEGLREAVEGLEVAESEDIGTVEGVLVLRGEVLEMDPGSRAARYWAGFGAGAARTKIRGELVDAASGRVLLRFTQERRSGVGMGGGNYVKLMQRNLRAIGEDLGAGVMRF